MIFVPTTLSDLWRSIVAGLSKSAVPFFRMGRGGPPTDEGEGLSLRMGLTREGEAVSESTWCGDSGAAGTWSD